MIETDPAKVARLQQAGEQLSGTSSGEDVFGGLYASGRLRDIEVNPAGWVSRSNAIKGKVFWGVGPQGQQLIDKLLFGPTSEQQANQHRLLHELGHLAIIDRDGRVRGRNLEFIELLDNIRSRSGGKLGLSAIALVSPSSHLNRSVDMKPHEDAADLFAILTRDEERYKSYLRYLQKDQPSVVEKKTSYGIATISPADARSVDRQLRAIHEANIFRYN